MLNQVKHAVKGQVSDPSTYSEIFINYLMSVQDRSIDAELKYSSVTLNPGEIIKEVNAIQKEMANSD